MFKTRDALQCHALARSFFLVAPISNIVPSRHKDIIVTSYRMSIYRTQPGFPYSYPHSHKVILNRRHLA